VIERQVGSGCFGTDGAGVGSTGATIPAAGRALALVMSVALLISGCERAPRGEPLPPLDPQEVQDQDDMTWDDYRPIPGARWADSTEPEREFRIALVAMDFPDQPFVITLPRESDPFGNPQVEPISRDSVPRFYADFFLRPGEHNHGQTINGYWMEQSRGKFGITALDPYGPYRMPKPRWEYGLNEYGQNEHTPDSSRASSRMEPDVDSLWAAEHGDIRADYDAVLRIYASYDETSVWQEFGEMKFDSKEDIPPEWGNPNPDMPRWIPTRYVEWTSWLAGAQQWGLSSMRQGESSGTITHELGHFAFRIPDLNNNPYVEPYRRVAAGPWDMMDRGSFNGPGGPHMRWVVPPTHGAAMPASLMLRNRMETGFVADSQVLALSREGLAVSGPAVARVTARAVEPAPGTFAGIVVRLDGEEPRDRTPEDDPAANPLSPGTPNYDAYSIEVVQRIGYDSFTPDNGVLIAKTKDSLRGRNGGPNAFNSFIWVIDAHPEDMSMPDYVKPAGDTVMRTIADYRQLNDALFHAGLDSGSEFEWTDEHNRLHFYVIDVHHDAAGIRSYVVGVRSMDRAGSHARGVALEAPAEAGTRARRIDTPLVFTVRNTGSAVETDPALHPSDATRFVGSDIYRLSASVEGEGWSVRLRNGLAAVGPGESRPVRAYVTAAEDAAATATVTVRAVSESDPSATAMAAYEVRR
jgi:M6 family metalloprotease-like protein